VNPVASSTSNYMNAVIMRMQDVQSRVLLKLFEVANRAEVTHTQPLGNIADTSRYVDTYA